jgi:Epoxide hydrolase N terminus
MTILSSPGQAREELTMSSDTVRPFRVEIPDGALDDLRRRIKATRWPSEELVADRSQGVQLATLQELARYWASDYDLGRVEARLNALPQFRTEIDGVDLHFLHIRSPPRAGVAADHDPRLAGLGDRAAGDHRPPDRPDRLWRRR